MDNATALAAPGALGACRERFAKFGLSPEEVITVPYGWIFSLPSHVSVSRAESGAFQLTGRDTAWSFPNVSEPVRQALCHGASLQQLERLSGGRYAELHFQLSQLDGAGLLCRTLVGTNGDRLATWVPFGPTAVFEDEPPAQGRLSRFAFMRRKQGQTVVESPLRPCRLVLYDWRATALLCAYPESPDLLSKPEAAALHCMMANCGLLDGDQDPPLWDFHSLLFHSRSRAGRSLGPHGVALPRPWQESCQEDESQSLELPGPDKCELGNPEPAFFQVVDRRACEREHGTVPISLDQVATFLWHAGREEAGRRPYPSAGKAYELEISLVVHNCQNLEGGVYRYRPRQHRLQKLPTAPEAGLLLEDARQAAGAKLAPQVLILLSARFAKMTSNYRSIAYSNILKDVGVVLQTMALTAAAMGLAACPLGTGDSDLFCRVFGTDYTLESSVGELVLGSSTKSSESG